MSRTTVLGAGSWGTAIALSLAGRDGHEVTLWSHRAETAAALELERENRRFLPGIGFPEALRVTADDAGAVAGAEILVSVIPSEFLRETMARLAGQMHAGQVLVSATKGIEDHSFLRMSQ